MTTTDRIVRIRTWNVDGAGSESTIETTPDHPFYKDGETAPTLVRDLHEDDMLRGHENSQLLITGIHSRKLTHPIYVYNFQVEAEEGSNNYFAGEHLVLVHNCDISQTLRGVVESAKRGASEVGESAQNFLVNTAVQSMAAAKAARDILVDKAFDRAAYEQATSSGLPKVPDNLVLQATDAIVRATPGASGDALLVMAAGLKGTAAAPAAAPRGTSVANAVKAYEAATKNASRAPVSDVAAEGVPSASTFVGRRGAPLARASIQPLRNVDSIIEGRTFSGHALDQMQDRGLVSSVVENAVRTGTRTPDPIVGRYRFYDAVNDFTVVAEGSAGERIVTVFQGKR